jgi:hypothetical protein
MTTYYVKNGGNDSADGLSDATAWASLGKAAGANIGAGDSVLFKRGSRWREEFVCYKGGSSVSSRLTFGAYGTGTAPIIDGSDIITGWTMESPSGGSSGEDFTDTSGSRPIAWWGFSETTGTRASTAGTGNGLVPSTNSPTRGTGPHGQFSAEFVKASSQQFTLAETSMTADFPGRSTVPNASVTVGGWVRVDAETAGDGGILSKDTNYQIMIEGSVVQFRVFGANNAGAAASGDSTTYSAGTWRHYVGRWTAGTGETVLFVNGVKKTPATITTRNTSTGAFQVGNATFKSNFDGALTELFVFNTALTDAQIASIYNSGLNGSRTQVGPTYYYKPFTSKPGGVFSDGNPLRLVDLKADMGLGNEWWDPVNFRQYVRLAGDDAPSGHTMEIGIRTYPMRIQGTDHWTIEDIWVRGAYKANIFADTNNDGIVRRCILTHASENGVHIYTHTNLSTQGFEVSNNVCYANGACGITVAGQNAISMAGIRIRNNETYGNCWQPRRKENDEFSFTGGIRPIGREINDCIIEDNYVHDEGIDGNYSHGCGIWFDTVGLNCIARRNRVERTSSWGIQIEDCNSVKAHSNVVVGTVYYPGIAIIRNCDNNLVYNNTLVNCQGGFNFSNGGGGSHFAGNQIFNNIVSQTTGRVILADTGVNTAANVSFNKNLFGPARTNFIYWNDDYSSYAAWEQALDGASNSIQVNPTFVNAAAGDYHLAVGSSGRSAGAALPAGTLDFVKTEFSGTPSVGALELSSATTILGTSAVRLSALRGAGVGTRVLPALVATSAVRLISLTGTGFGTRTIPAKDATSAVRLTALRGTATGTASLPTFRIGVSAVFLTALRGTATGARTIPARTGTSASRWPNLSTLALGTTGTTSARIGASAVRLTALRGTAIGARAIPTRTGTSAVVWPKLSVSALGTAGNPTSRIGVSIVRLVALRGLGNGTRTVPNRIGTSAIRWLKFVHAALGLRTVPGGFDIVPHINAPAWRTADFGDGSARVSWRSALDPGEKKAYTINCGTELAGENRIEIVNVALSGLAVLAGLRIRAMSNDLTNVTLWLEVNATDRTRPNWNGDGETHTLTCTIDVTDGQRFERDVAIQIKQLGQ